MSKTTPEEAKALAEKYGIKLPSTLLVPCSNLVRLAALIDEVRIPPNATKGDEAHPENRCEHCHGPNITWFAPNDLWNAYAGNSDIICPICFVAAAKAAGFVPTAWVVTPETFGSKSTKGDEVSDVGRAVVLDIGFQYENGAHTPTVLIGFAVDDWESRDKFVAAIRTAQKG